MFMNNSLGKSESKLAHLAVLCKKDLADGSLIRSVRSAAFSSTHLLDYNAESNLRVASAKAAVCKRRFLWKAVAVHELFRASP